MADEPTAKPAPKAPAAAAPGQTQTVQAGGTPGGAPPGPPSNYKAILQAMVQKNASDLHLKVGRPPTIRLDGDLEPLDLPPLKPDDLRNIADQIMPPKQRKEFEVDKEADFA